MPQAQPAASSSRTMTITSNPSSDPSQPDADDSNPPIGVLKLRGGPVRQQRVLWSDEVVDNEHMGKKKSKSEFVQTTPPPPHADWLHSGERNRFPFGHIDLVAKSEIADQKSAAYITSPEHTTNPPLNPIPTRPAPPHPLPSPKSQIGGTEQRAHAERGQMAKIPNRRIRMVGRAMDARGLSKGRRAGDGGGLMSMARSVMVIIPTNLDMGPWRISMMCSPAGQRVQRRSDTLIVKVGYRPCSV